MRYLFAIINLGIFCGYVFLSAFIAPKLKVEYLITKIGGALFFLTCGLTHLELAAHSWSNTPFDLTSWHMLAVHVPQLLSVWLFVGGLYKEFVKGHAEWPVAPEIK